MPFITWNEKYALEIKEVDKQHEYLVKLINDLHDAMKAGKAKDILANTINELIRYTSTHFALEEKYMSQYQYSDLKSHKAEHQKFVDQVLEFQKNFQNGSTLISIDILNFLRDWLLKHISVTDKKYVPLMKEKGIR